MKKGSKYLKICNAPYKKLDEKMSKGIAIATIALTVVSLALTATIVAIHVKSK